MKSIIIAEKQGVRALQVLLLWIFLLVTSAALADTDSRKTSATITTIHYQVVETFPHRTDAFTQGLEVFDEDVLLESVGRYGQSELRLTDLENGKVIRAHKLSEKLFAEGATLWNGLIYQLTWNAGKALVYDAKSFSYQKSFKYRGQGWGLTHNDQHFIMSDGSPILRFRSPKDFSEVRRIEVTRHGKPQKYLNELEWINGLIFANIYQKHYIVAIDPRHGKVIAELDIARLYPGSGGVANGIAWDAEREQMLVTGKLWNKIFALRLDTVPIAPR